MLKKLIKTIPIFIALFSVKTFALSYTQPEYCRKWEIYFDLVQNFSIERALDITDIKVKFTQDDTYYYFDVNAEACLNSSARNVLSDVDSRWQYSCPFDGRTFRGGDLYPYLYGSSGFTDRPIYRYTETHISNGGEYSSNYEYIMVNGSTIATMNYKNEFRDTRKSYYNTWYSTYYYIPQPFSDYSSFGYGSKWNPNTGSYSLYFANATEALPSHDGFALLSRGSSIKSKTMSGSKVSTCTFQIYSKLRMEKMKFSRYRYLAFGGPLYVAYDDGNNFFVKLYASCGSSNTYDLNEHTHCDHDWYYTYDDGSGTHNKICRNCEWCITKDHEFLYEYDGFEKNMCECGCTKKVNAHFYINDDKIKEKHFVHNSNTDEEYARYTEKEGYRFLYYEKYEKQLASNSNVTYSTTSTALKNILVATISTASSIDGKVKYRTLSYNAVSEELRFKINYYSTNGVFDNEKDNISKEYTYWRIKNLEKLHGIRDDLNYLAYWRYKDKTIRSISDIRKCIIGQDMILDLYAVYDRLQYGKSEKTGDGGEPQNGGGLNDKKKYKDEKSEKGPGYNDITEIQNEEEGKEIKQFIFETENETIKNEIEKNVYAMTKTDIIDLCKHLGLNPATISNISRGYKYKIDSDNLLIKLLYLFIKYKLFIIILVVAFVVIYLVLW